MEAEAVCRRRTDSHSCCCTVPTVAAVHETGRVVPEYGHAGPDWTVLRHGHLPADSLYHHNVYSTAGAMVVSESIRGCGVIPLVPSCVGMAGGELPIILSTPSQSMLTITIKTAEDIKAKKLAKKEKKAAKAAARAEANGKPAKSKKGGTSPLPEA